MKNSKRFPTPACWDTGLMTAGQMAACRDVFPATPPLCLTVIDLPALAAALATDEAGLLAAGLGPTEIARFRDLRLPKRRLEWLGGRLAAKGASLDWLGPLAGSKPTLRDVVVESESSGRPRLCWPQAAGLPPPAIAISHSGRYAAALAVTGPGCGLDVQVVSPKVTAVGERFATPAEVELLSVAPCLAGLEPPVRLSLLWAAKEACRKAIACSPLLGFLEMGLDAVQDGADGGLTMRLVSRRPGLSLPPVFVAHRSGYAIAITAL